MNIEDKSSVMSVQLSTDQAKEKIMRVRHLVFGIVFAVIWWVSTLAPEWSTAVAAPLNQTIPSNCEIISITPLEERKRDLTIELVASAFPGPRWLVEAMTGQKEVVAQGTGVDNIRSVFDVKYNTRYQLKIEWPPTWSSRANCQFRFTKTALEDDELEMFAGTTNEFDLLENDVVPEEVTVSIEVPGDLQVEQIGQGEIQVIEPEVGSYVIPYMVPDASSGEARAASSVQALATLTVSANPCPVFVESVQRVIYGVVKENGRPVRYGRIVTAVDAHGMLVGCQITRNDGTFPPMPIHTGPGDFAVRFYVDGVLFESDPEVASWWALEDGQYVVLSRGVSEFQYSIFLPSINSP